MLSRRHLATACAGILFAIETVIAVPPKTRTWDITWERPHDDCKDQNSADSRAPHLDVYQIRATWLNKNQKPLVRALEELKFLSLTNEEAMGLIEQHITFEVFVSNTEFDIGVPIWEAVDMKLNQDDADDIALEIKQKMQVLKKCILRKLIAFLEHRRKRRETRQRPPQADQEIRGTMRPKKINDKSNSPSETRAETPQKKSSPQNADATESLWDSIWCCPVKCFCEQIGKLFCKWPCDVIQCFAVSTACVVTCGEAQRQRMCGCGWQCPCEWSSEFDV